MLNKIAIAICLLSTLLFYGQTKKEVNKIVSTYNFRVLDSLKEKYSKDYTQNKLQAIHMAKINNWPLTKVEHGNYMELQKISDQGKPIYYTTYNLAAAKSTRATFLYNNGGLNLNVEGQNMVAFVWDGKTVRVSHQEFIVNGTSKVVIADGATVSGDHATHVMGTMIAEGTQAAARGMAFQANGYSLDWNNDAAEATSAVGIGMLISNHSYGPIFENVSPWYLGAYSADSRVWDEIMYNAPFYLHCVAAGNDGQKSNTSAIGGISSYDKLSSAATAKNTMAVANAYDAIINTTDGSILGGGTIHPSSSQGPTDDLRIKPDITGNGYNVYSPTNTSDSSYQYFTGTSMASPNVAGTLLLLQQLYAQETANYMYAATLKGLALHTADDRGLNGPDARYGWGLLNAKRAAEVILSNIDIISENTLNNNDTYSFQVTTDGTKPLEASISWTDPAGVANSGTLNDNTPVLVNDLDIRITKGGDVFYPWKLSSVNTNTKADNIVDPFEKIEITNPGNNTYTITVSHKGTLENNSQNYSLIVTGITSSTVGVSDDSISDFKIYPNPTIDKKVNLVLSENLVDANLLILDITGRTVYQKALGNSIMQAIDLQNLNSGLYLIKIANKNTKIIKKLIIK